MKTVYQIILVLICSAWLAPPGLHAQFFCVDSLFVELGPDGTYTIFPEDLLQVGDLNGLDAVVTPSVVDCDDTGSGAVAMDIYDNGELIYSCVISSYVYETENPVALCQQEITVTLNQNGQYAFTFEDLDNGSWDNCGSITHTISPVSIDCDSPNPAPVALQVIDESGNFSICTTLVNWDPHGGPIQTIACNDGLVFYLGEGEEYLIEADVMLAGGPYACDPIYVVTLTADGVERPEPVVTLADTNVTLVVAVTDTDNDVTCWAEVSVEAPAGCTFPFVICDTECHAAPLTDCAGGHTNQDMIEWPCDIFIDDACGGEPFGASPATILALGYAGPEDASPQVVNGDCYQTEITYADEVDYQIAQQIIDRTWTVTYLATGQQWTYVQQITASYPVLEICDTEPWTAPVGDCDSGHTLSDGVEWPADITIAAFYITPDELLESPNVAPEDAAPRMFHPCDSIFIDYTDVITPQGGSILVERTWSIYDPPSSTTWEYLQNILVLDDPGNSRVCVWRESGEGVPNVELLPGVFTDATGCVVFEDPAGIIVTPTRQDAQEAAVTVVDQIIQMEYLLELTELSDAQLYAADLNGSLSVSALDVVMMQQLRWGTLDPPLSTTWKFFDQATFAGAVDISDPLSSYNFTAVKMGDLDNSFELPGQHVIPQSRLYLDDEILNAGEPYTFAFRLDQNIRLNGFSVSFAIDPEIASFLSVASDLLPGFDPAEHVRIEGGIARIDYIAPPAYFRQGVAVPAGSELVRVALMAEANSILSEALTLSADLEHVIKVAGTQVPVSIDLELDNVIVSSTLQADAGRQLAFYPNPVADRITFSGLTPGETGRVTVFDVTGRAVHHTTLQSTMDMSALHTGTYYLSVDFDGGQRATGILYKQ